MKLNIKIEETTEASSSLNNNLPSPKSAIYRYRCSHCDLAFRCENRMRQHEIGHLGVFRVAQKCPFNGVNCHSNELFETPDTLRSHIQLNHKNQTINDFNEKLSSCDLCDEHFEQDENVINSFLTHLQSNEHLKRANNLIQKSKDDDDNGIKGANNNENDDDLGGALLQEQVKSF